MSQEEFKALNRRQRRWSDHWFYRTQWIVGSAGTLLLVVLVAYNLVRYFHVH